MSAGAVGPEPPKNKSSNWTDSETRWLLEALEPYRASVRGRYVEEGVWTKIHDYVTGTGKVSRHCVCCTSAAVKSFTHLVCVSFIFRCER